jgi:hypothetical protein
VQLNFEFGNYHLPKFICPKARPTAFHILKTLREGFIMRYGEGKDEVAKQLDMSLK